MQTDLDGIGGNINAANKADDLASILSGSLGLLHLGVKGGEPLEEVVPAGAGLELLGDQALNWERGGRLDREAGETGEDGELSGNIEAVEIVARIGLSVAECLGLLDFVGPLAALALSGGERVEKERHGAAKDTFNLGHLVAGIDEVLEGRDDGQTGADGGLMVDLGAGGGGGDGDIFPQLVRAGEGLFVGCNNANAAGEGKGVLFGDVLRARVVDEDRLGWGSGQVLDDLGQLGRRLGGGSKRVQSGVDVDFRVVVVEEGLAAGGDVAESKLGGWSSGRKSLKLRQEGLANTTSA